VEVPLLAVARVAVVVVSPTVSRALSVIAVAIRAAVAIATAIAIAT
jgi:hypothetical protein